ncbi:hypothetical protein Angca_002903, partial [Angiostrongylus cantonensis]
SGRESVVLTSLPPVVFMFNLPPEYPLVQPELELECEWMNEELMSTIKVKLEEVCSENLGMGVLFFCYEAIADVVKSRRNLLELPQYATSQFQNMERIELLRRVDDSGARSADYHFNSVCHDCEIRPLGCLAFDCSSLASQQAIQSIIGKKEFERYERLLLEQALAAMIDVVPCPRKTCQNPVFVSERTQNLATCEMCGYSFCVLCYRAYHGLNECHFKDVDKESLVTKWDSADEKERIQMGQRFGGLQNLQ